MIFFVWMSFTASLSAVHAEVVTNSIKYKSTNHHIVGEQVASGGGSLLGYTASEMDNIGEHGSGDERRASNPIIGLELPYLFSPIVSAEISIKKTVSTVGLSDIDVDLYGFNPGVDPTNSGTNYYWSSAVEDTDGISRLAAGFMQYEDADPTVRTADITDYIKALYNEQTPLQSEVFFRLNPNAAIEVGGATYDRIEYDPASVLLRIVTTNHYSVSTAHGGGADTWVREFASDAGVYGNYSYLAARFNASTHNANILMRFDLNDVKTSLAQFPSPTLIRGAALVLTARTNYNFTATFNVYGLKDSAAGQDWVENSITYGNASMFNYDSDATTRDRDDSVLTYLGSFSSRPIKQDDEVFFTSQALASFINSDRDGKASLLIEREDTGNWYDFRSKNFGAQAAPYLVLYSGPPYPSTFRFR